jgi:hypothetical protein
VLSFDELAAVHKITRTIAQIGRKAELRRHAVSRRITTVITPTRAITVVVCRCNCYDNLLAGCRLPALIHLLDHLTVGAHEGLDPFIL